MKIILSPSKGKYRLTLEGGDELLFPKETDQVLNLIRGLSKEDLGHKLKIKGQLLEDLYHFYQNYQGQVTSPAYKVYDGVAFKGLDVASFSQEDLVYAKDHLLIMSALYGLVTPITAIKSYRLDMNNALVKGYSLYKLWNQPINSYLEGEELIFNLASKEYYKILKNQRLVDFEFLDYFKGQWKATSHHSKYMRGAMARYIIQHRIENPEALQSISLEGYTYSPEESEANRLVYKKDL